VTSNYLLAEIAHALDHGAIPLDLAVRLDPQSLRDAWTTADVSEHVYLLLHLRRDELFSHLRMIGAEIARITQMPIDAVQAMLGPSEWVIQWNGDSLPTWLVDLQVNSYEPGPWTSVIYRRRVEESSLEKRGWEYFQALREERPQTAIFTALNVGISNDEIMKVLRSGTVPTIEEIVEKADAR
jgi:hypothetical protein